MVIDPIDVKLPNNSIAEKEQADRESFLHLMVWANMIMAGAILLFSIVTYFASDNGGGQLLEIEGLLFSATLLVSFGINGWFALTTQPVPYRFKAMTVILLNISIGLADFALYGLTGDARPFLIIAAIMAIVLFNWRVALTVCLVATAAHFTAGLLIQQGILIPLLSRLPGDGSQLWYQSIISGVFFVGLGAFSILILLRNTLTTLHKQQDLIDQIQKQSASLDRIVRERTRVLSLMVEINRTLTSILSVEQLVAEVVDQIQHAFGYYYVQVYLLDKENQLLKMAGGTGETGSALLLGRHKLATSRGLAGRAIREKRAILAKDVTKDPDWVANPLLPETKSEITFPIIVNNEVIALLDIQQNVTNGFNQEDELILTNITLQMGVALQNATRYLEAQVRSHRESILNETTRRIQLAPDLESTLQTVVEAIGRELRTPRTNASLDLNALKNAVDGEAHDQ